MTRDTNLSAPPATEREAVLKYESALEREAALERADRELITRLQREAFRFFIKHANPENGLVADSSQDNSPSSIAATGLALTCYPIAVERGLLSRRDAVKRTQAALRFFCEAPQDGARDGVGYQGFFYHFLDMKSGRRAWKSELSSIDTALLFAGALACGVYFDTDSTADREIRERAEELYRRADWNWMQNGGLAVGHGWKPGRGFLVSRWQGYSEALILYVLGLASPTHPLPVASYQAWTEGFRWKKIYGFEHLYAGPLFIHQMSQVWLDLRGLQDAFMREKNSDYFENSRRATYVQREYAIRNSPGFAGYGANCWGVTASDGPGSQVRQIAGRKRRFYDYIARGVPFGPDDGTISPWVTAASLPFCPEIVLPALRCFNELKLGPIEDYGFEATFNPTFPEQTESLHGWVSPYHLGVNQGPFVAMLENFRSGLLWDLMRRCPFIENGLRRAGFQGGWLSQS